MSLKGYAIWESDVSIVNKYDYCWYTQEITVEIPTCFMWEPG
jgi:hypothetical protein